MRITSKRPLALLLLLASAAASGMYADGGEGGGGVGEGRGGSATPRTHVMAPRATIPPPTPAAPPPPSARRSRRMWRRRRRPAMMPEPSSAWRNAWTRNPGAPYGGPRVNARRIPTTCFVSCDIKWAMDVHARVRCGLVYCISLRLISSPLLPPFLRMTTKFISRLSAFLQ